MTADADMTVTVTPAVVPAVAAAAEPLIDAAAAAKPVVTAAADLAPAVTVQMYMLANQGIDKSGNQSLTATNVWTRLSPWVVRAGYPATNIVDGDGIQVPAGLVASFEYRLAVGTSAGTGNTQSMRLVNGSAVVDSVTIANTSTSATRSGTFTGTGEVVRLEANVTSTGGRGTITSSTYLVINVL
ncbi:hypothetical protein ACFULT_26235 [Rhodococcus sp. NPDC057297]|uniref:hypothetical protein n=1 Tax=Rhodococcus sp. NPDC057297 TaxID=3346090 RepID=UPI00362D664C